MRGSPILRTAVVLALLLLAALPLWHLTRNHAVPVPVAKEECLAKETIKVLKLHLKFAHAPRNFQLLHLGKIVWSVPVNGAVLFQTEIAIPYPKEGVDMELKVQWPDTTPETAVRLEVETPDKTIVQKTLWGRGEMDEILTFP